MNRGESGTFEPSKALDRRSCIAAAGQSDGAALWHLSYWKDCDGGEARTIWWAWERAKRDNPITKNLRRWVSITKWNFVFNRKQYRQHIKCWTSRILLNMLIANLVTRACVQYILCLWSEESRCCCCFFELVDFGLQKHSSLGATLLYFCSVEFKMFLFQFFYKSMLYI